MTGWYLSDFTLVVDLMLLATAYCNLLSGENNLARCLASWHDTVPILDIIGRIEI